MRTVRFLAVFLAAVAALRPAPAPAYPTGPVRVIAPAPPGTPRDLRARWIAEKLAPSLGQAVVVENRAGAGGSIGMEAAARSLPDGHTLVVVDSGTLTYNPHVYARTGYDALADFAPVTRLVDSMLMLAVHPQVPAQDVAELLRHAREKPGHVAYGSSGIGTPPHLAGELFRRMGGVEITHVPYKGAAAALADLLAGRIAFTIDSVAMQLPQVRAGKLRALAVTGARRLPFAPELPTLAEAGLAGYEYRAWMGVAVPAATPRPIVARLNAELVRAVREPAGREWFAKQGGEAVGDSPEEFAAVIRADHAHWGKIIREAGIRAD